MSVLQEITTVTLTQDASTMMGVSRAAAMKGTLVMGSAAKVNCSSNFGINT